MRRRILLGIMAVAILLGIGEAGLQLLARVTAGEIDRTPGDAVDANAIRILCVGDSHTYGAGVRPGGGYPAQLARRLKPAYAPQPLRVINAGLPGVNSAFVALRLADELERRRPHVVIVWVGTNNRWNSLETESWRDHGFVAALDRALLNLKLYRLMKVLWAGREEASAAAQPGDPFAGMPQRRRETTLDDVEVGEGIRHDMERMVAIARSASTPIVFVTYPLPGMAGPNAAIERNATRLGVPVVVTARDYARARAAGYRHDELIVRAAGPHPTEILYGFVAESLQPVVQRLLAGHHGIRPPETPVFQQTAP